MSTAYDPDHRDFLVIGPWNHGGSNGDGTGLGALHFNGDTAFWFRSRVLQPFNIFRAEPADFRKATQHIYAGGQNPSRIELPLVPAAEDRSAGVHAVE